MFFKRERVGDSCVVKNAGWPKLFRVPAILPPEMERLAHDLDGLQGSLLFGPIQTPKRLAGLGHWLFTGIYMAAPWRKVALSNPYAALRGCLLGDQTCLRLEILMNEQPHLGALDPGDSTKFAVLRAYMETRRGGRENPKKAKAIRDRWVVLFENNAWIHSTQ